MDLSPDTTQFSNATRRDGWTPALKARFLALLAEAGNARLAARRCGFSAQSAYAQRRRDGAFARGWAAALVLAREHSEQVLADRAIEGVEEPVFYRGEQVGTRRRYDSRLLLAHLARLDRLAGDEAATRDVDRFDELLALVAGEPAPEELTDDAGIVPVAREAHADAAAEAAEQEAKRASPKVRGAAAQRQREAAVIAAGDAAWSEAAARWDTWFDHACGVVDALARDVPHPSAQHCSYAEDIPSSSEEGRRGGGDAAGIARVSETGRRREHHPPAPSSEEEGESSSATASFSTSDSPASPPFHFAPRTV